MPKDADVYLKHILDECSYLNSATREMDFFFIFRRRNAEACRRTKFRDYR